MVSIDVDFCDISNDVSNDDLIEELEARGYTVKKTKDSLNQELEYMINKSNIACSWEDFIRGFKESLKDKDNYVSMTFINDLENMLLKEGAI